MGPKLKVKDCGSCEHCKRYVWSHLYTPASYHAIGMSHAYHKCSLSGQRIIEMDCCPKEKTK